jgi:cysteine synthase
MRLRQKRCFRAHFLGTGAEIWQQSHGKLDGFCDFVGTGGSFAGCAASLKVHNAKIRCYAVEPLGGTAHELKKTAMASHAIQGGGYGIAHLAPFDRSNVDGFVSVSGADAKYYTQLLAKEEGIYAGYSTGANLAAAVKLLQGPLNGGSIAILACDSGQATQMNHIVRCRISCAVCFGS